MGDETIWITKALCYLHEAASILVRHPQGGRTSVSPYEKGYLI